MQHETTVLFGIELPSTDPLFLAVVGVHVLAGITSVLTGAIAMLSQKRAGRHPTFGTLYFGDWPSCLSPPQRFRSCDGPKATIYLSWGAYPLRQLYSAERHGGSAGAVGCRCTSLAWECPTSSC